MLRPAGMKLRRGQAREIGGRWLERLVSNPETLKSESSKTANTNLTSLSLHLLAAVYYR